MPKRRLFVVPYRYRDRVDGEEPGWFDYQPLSAVYPTAIWNQSMDPADWERIERLRAAETIRLARRSSLSQQGGGRS
jgi:hypothetical protein